MTTRAERRLERASGGPLKGLAARRELRRRQREAQERQERERREREARERQQAQAQATPVAPATPARTVTERVKKTETVTTQVPRTETIKGEKRVRETVPDLARFQADLVALGASKEVARRETALLKTLGIEEYTKQKRTISVTTPGQPAKPTAVPRVNIDIDVEGAIDRALATGRTVSVTVSESGDVRDIAAAARASRAAQDQRDQALAKRDQALAKVVRTPDGKIDVTESVARGQDDALRTLGIEQQVIGQSKIFLGGHTKIQGNVYISNAKLRRLPLKAQRAVLTGGLDALNTEGLSGKALFNKQKELGYIPAGATYITERDGKVQYTLEKQRRDPLVLEPKTFRVFGKRITIPGTTVFFKTPTQQLREIKEFLVDQPAAAFASVADVLRDSIPGLSRSDAAAISPGVVAISKGASVPASSRLAGVTPLGAAVLLAFAHEQGQAKSRAQVESVLLDPTLAKELVKRNPNKPVTAPRLPGTDISRTPPRTRTEERVQPPQLTNIPGVDQTTRSGATLFKAAQAVVQKRHDAEKVITSRVAEKSMSRDEWNAMWDALNAAQTRKAQNLDALLQEAANTARRGKVEELLNAVRRDSASSKALDEALKRKQALEDARRAYIQSLSPSPAQPDISAQPGFSTAFAQELQEQGLTQPQVLTEIQRLQREGVVVYQATASERGVTALQRVLTRARTSTGAATGTTTQVLATPAIQTRVRTRFTPTTSTKTILVPVTSETTRFETVTRTIPGSPAAPAPAATATSPGTTPSVPTVTPADATARAGRATARARRARVRGLPLPRFDLPGGRKLPPGQFPRIVQFITGISTRTVDLDSGAVRVTRTPKSRLTAKARPSFRVMTVDNTPPRRRKIDLGAFDLFVTGKGISFVRDSTLKVSRPRAGLKSNMRRR